MPAMALGMGGRADAVTGPPRPAATAMQQTLGRAGANEMPALEETACTWQLGLLHMWSPQTR